MDHFLGSFAESQISWQALEREPLGPSRSPVPSCGHRDLIPTDVVEHVSALPPAPSDFSSKVFSSL